VLTERYKAALDTQTSPVRNLFVVAVLLEVAGVLRPLMLLPLRIAEGGAGALPLDFWHCLNSVM